MGKMGQNGTQHLRLGLEGTRWDTLGHVGTQSLGQFFFLHKRAPKKNTKKLRRPNVKIFRPQGPKFPKSIWGEAFLKIPRPRPKENVEGGQGFFSPDFPFGQKCPADPPPCFPFACSWGFLGPPPDRFWDFWLGEKVGNVVGSELWSMKQTTL